MTLLASRADGVGVRRAVAADLTAIVDLLADDPIGLSRETTDAAVYERAFAAIDADPREFLAAVVDGAAVIGTFQLSILPGLSRAGSSRAQIEAVRVSAARRSDGVGRWMIEWAIGEARRRGCDLVQLTADRRRDDAHRFYAGLGFEASHIGFKLQL